MIFARDKYIWLIYIYDINGATVTLNIKNISHGGLENLLAGAVKYLKFMQEIIENRARQGAMSA